MQWYLMSHLLQGLCVGLLSLICDRPSVSVLNSASISRKYGNICPLYLEWEDSSAGPTLICVVVVIIIVVVVLCVCVCVCWLYMWVGAKVVSFVHPISLVVLNLWPLLLVGKGLSVLLAN